MHKISGLPGPRKIACCISAFVLSVSILAACVVGSACTDNPVQSETEQSTMDILIDTLAYIKAHHADAAEFISDNITFTSSYSGKEKQGYSGVTYTGGGWTVSVGHAIVPNYAYSIKADYSNGKIVWVGTSKNGQIQEESYTKLN